MITPRRALVRPRVLVEQSGEVLPLEIVLQDLMAGSSPGQVHLTGSAGSGKTTALQHLAFVFSESELVVIDDASTGDLEKLPSSKWIAFTSPFARTHPGVTHTFQLVPWGRDDWIEYLLAAHKQRCGSVIERLRTAGDMSRLQGNPELCRLVLDELATHESIPSARIALLNHIEENLPSPEARLVAEVSSYDLVLCEDGVEPLWSEPQLEELVIAMERRANLRGWVTPQRHSTVRLILAAAYLVRTLRHYGDCRKLEKRFPRSLVEETGLEAARHPEILDILQSGLDGDPEWHAMAASILHASGINWRPEAGGKLKLNGAYLDCAKWQGVVLPEVLLWEADLSHADLQEAELSGAKAIKANFNHANLCRASMQGFVAFNANFAQANLSRCRILGGRFDDANLEGASLVGADLREAIFRKANLTRACFRDADLSKASFDATILDDADFSNANLSGAFLSELKLHVACLTGARFQGARMVACNLEEMELPGADFRKANLRKALLTATSMPGACFDGACLAGAGLAEIDWEGASLRGADLTGVSFHLGSTRCGHVGSPIACEGSRTGFYTDEYTEQDFKAPEEIRKANLCHADLRDAIIHDVDFYLVDLRHARFDPHQETHLRRCGAILESRA
jgi:uncharacterized protein YjbI with pentapeptide repeats